MRMRPERLLSIWFEDEETIVAVFRSANIQSHHLSANANFVVFCSLSMHKVQCTFYNTLFYSSLEYAKMVK
jgi:hypothetical protein